MDTYFKVHHHWNIDRKKVTLYLQVQNALNTDQSISIIGWEPKTSTGTTGWLLPSPDNNQPRLAFSDSVEHQKSTHFDSVPGSARRTNVIT